MLCKQVVDVVKNTWKDAMMRRAGQPADRDPVRDAIISNYRNANGIQKACHGFAPHALSQQEYRASSISIVKCCTLRTWTWRWYWTGYGGSICSVLRSIIIHLPHLPADAVRWRLMLRFPCGYQHIVPLIYILIRLIVIARRITNEYELECAS